ncbi:hypothetical protein FGADI_3926 [Fusarium gaditjirri]|uniref:Uncharacterized protein n=1 Tax=Fusarium gaditjirri TaxID=282569 RepID=A0A8H4TEF9_9HYPO|nr:hypothetical protein FGADI_3926 [Fusarium gaditjirri]
MKRTLATLTLVALTAATPPPEPVVLKPVPDKASSGCYHYQTTAVFLASALAKMAITTNSTKTPGAKT